MKLDTKNKKWKEFVISDILEIEKSTNKSLSNKTSSNGVNDYVGATSKNNGNVGFVSNKYKNLLKHGECIVFINTGEGSVGEAIYKKNNFIPSNNVTVGRSKILNEYVGNFIVTINNNQSDKYSYGYIRNEKRLKRDVLILPTNKKGEPDFEFMEAYMKQKEKEKLQEYNNYITRRLEKLKDFKNVVPLEEKEWREFKLKSIFNPTKGDQNKMTDLKKGNYPLVSAKNGNNGLKDFVTKNNKKVYSENTLTLNNDGDGGAGISYYQPFEYLLDSHVTSLNPKNQLNKLTLLFISRCITKQRNKFGHGYSLTNNRLTAFKIMLPITTQNEPDYEYMENYMKQLEYKKLKEYLKIKGLN